MKIIFKVSAFCQWKHGNACHTVRIVVDVVATPKIQSRLKNEIGTEKYLDLLAILKTNVDRTIFHYNL